MSNHVTPSIGRIVWYRGKDNQVRAAIVTYVWSQFLINLHAFGKDQNDPEAGIHTSVTHGDIEHEPSCCPSWSWMPYQKGQAAKTEQLEQKLVGAGTAAITSKPIRIPTIEDVAEACHEINRAYCQAIGDNSQPAWKDAPEWQRSSAINGVKFHLANPGASPSASHESWLAQKTAEGWKYGPVKDADKKEHPCFVPYSDLPNEQKAKDYLFKQTAHSFMPFIFEESPLTELPVVNFSDNSLPHTVSDDAIEQEIQAKRLTAPRVTPQDIEANIVGEHYFTAYQGASMATSGPIPGALSLLTFCVLVLRNGFTVTGESACASPENFDAEIGRKIARENAVQKIWPLLGFALKERLHDQQNPMPTVERQL